ncbi:hypothetical protein EMIT0111MI5_70269 [Burkholderia sp. IT-111MI5]
MFPPAVPAPAGGGTRRRVRKLNTPIPPCERRVVSAVTAAGTRAVERNSGCRRTNRRARRYPRTDFLPIVHRSRSRNPEGQPRRCSLRKTLIPSRRDADFGRIPRLGAPPRHALAQAVARARATRAIKPSGPYTYPDKVWRIAIFRVSSPISIPVRYRKTRLKVLDGEFARRV